MQSPQTRYARSGDFNIAYQVVGDAEHDLVFAPGIISSVELVWEEPRWESFLHRLASFSRLVLFDRRGQGMSDRVTGVPTLEERTDDLRAVLEAVRSERSALFGSGDAGALFALYAASHPDRTTALVLLGVQPRWRKADDYPWGFDPAEAQRWVEEPEQRFADPEFVRANVLRVAPSLEDEEEPLAWYARTWRLSEQALGQLRPSVA